MQEIILRKKQVLVQVGLSRASLYRLLRAQKFPKPLRLTGAVEGGKSVGWLQSEITAWIQARIAERDAA